MLLQLVILVVLLVLLSQPQQFKHDLSLILGVGLLYQTISHFVLYMRDRSLATEWRARFHSIFKLEFIISFVGFSILFLSFWLDNWFGALSWLSWAIVGGLFICYLYYLFVSIRDFIVAKKMVEQAFIVDLGA